MTCKDELRVRRHTAEREDPAKRLHIPALLTSQHCPRAAHVVDPHHSSLQPARRIGCRDLPLSPYEVVDDLHSQRFGRDLEHLRVRVERGELAVLLVRQPDDDSTRRVEREHLIAEDARDEDDRRAGRMGVGAVRFERKGCEQRRVSGKSGGVELAQVPKPGADPEIPVKRIQPASSR